MTDKNDKNDRFDVKIIARIHTDFPTKFGIPRQSGVVSELKGKIVFEQEYRNSEALRGIEGFSHLWLIWQFSEAVRDTWSPTVRPPILGGNTRIGVFATRSPFRPNAIGLSSVKLEGIQHTAKHGDVLIVSGADLMDGTPIIDIKPYLPYVDSHPEATEGFRGKGWGRCLDVNFPEGLLAQIPPDQQPGLLGVLKNDPRPSYHHDAGRVYGMPFGKHEIKFQVDDSQKLLRVIAVEMI